MPLLHACRHPPNSPHAPTLHGRGIFSFIYPTVTVPNAFAILSPRGPVNYYTLLVTGALEPAIVPIIRISVALAQPTFHSVL